VIDAFLVFMMVTLVPIAFLGIGGRAEHALFIGWRWLQVATLLAAGGYVLYRMATRSRRDLILLVVIAACIAYLGLSYVGIYWDAQIEYNRVLLLADRFGSLTEGYRHGNAHWIFGYPPGATLSVMFFSTLHMISPNVAQGILLVLWCGAFLVRHLRDVDLPSKIVFFLLLATGAQFAWHATYFYNNLFYALLWAQLVLAPLFGSTLSPWERCGTALVLVWLRPQWEIAAIPIATSALTTLLIAPRVDRRLVRDTTLATLVALAVAWHGNAYWQRASPILDQQMSQHGAALIDEAAATQHDSRTLDVQVTTKPTAVLATPVPALVSGESVDAIAWAFKLTREKYPLSSAALCMASLFALASLRRRGLAFIVPLLGPLGLVVGTAVFARGYADYRANSGALERLQIIVPILSAGVLAALPRTLRAPAR
jgi:hypothetical protein